MAGIYIHIPFCKQACSYCDFHFSTNTRNAEVLIEALIKELILRKDFLSGELVNSIYFGGGTPSIVSSSLIEKILRTIQQNFRCSDDIEITLEGNPDDLNYSKLKELKAIGINRLSVGIQSFYDDDLLFMNRAHDAQESVSVLDNINKVGFKNYTIDLIYGYNSLSNSKWQQNLNYLVEFDVPHFSAYALTIEPKTKLAHEEHKNGFRFVKDEVMVTHFKILTDFAKTNNYGHYEISNFCKLNMESRHNSSYWHEAPFLGVGPSAHSFNGKERSWNIANNNQYVKGIENNISVTTSETLSKFDKHNEYVMTKLRLDKGIDLNEFTVKFDDASKENLLLNGTKWVDRCYLQKDNNHLKLTHIGKLFADKIAADLFIIE